MKLPLIAILVLIGALVGYCSLPLKSVAVLTVTVVDQDNKKLSKGAKAIYSSSDGTSLVEITSETPGSWDNNLHWWAHSSHKKSLLRPEDARKAASVRIEAQGCEPVHLPVSLNRKYEPLSFEFHGGGPAYLIYRFDAQVKLKCTQNP